MNNVGLTLLRMIEDLHIRRDRERSNLLALLKTRMTQLEDEMVQATKVKMVEIVRTGTQVHIPEHADLRVVLENIKRKIEEEDQETKITEVIRTFPWDGAHAFAKAMEKQYGYVTQVPTPGFFGPQPPELRAVEVGVGKTVHVPWGRFTLPGIEGFLQTGMSLMDGQLAFVVMAVVKKKYEKLVKALVDEARAYLIGGSIYRGKAIKIRFTDPEGEDLDPQQIQPKFLDLSQVQRSQLVFSSEVQRQIEHYFFTHILYRTSARELGVPGKRGVLFEGKPGTGKTLTMMVGARLATDKGITVVYSESANDFERVVQFALQYAPAMVVCEDIDRVVSGERDIKIDRILNVLDGIETKNQDVTVVLTSNNVDQIQQALLRPGRIDVSIRFQPPDQAAAQKLIRLYGGRLVDSREDLTAVGISLEGQIPAVIREVVERSKLSALYRSQGAIHGLQVTGADLVLAAGSIQEQLSLLNRQPKPELTDLQKGAAILAEGVAKGLTAVAESNTWTPPIPKVVDVKVDGVHGPGKSFPENNKGKYLGE